MLKALTPRRARATPRERRQLIALGLAAIYEGLVYVLSLGYLSVKIRAHLLFDVFED